MKKEIKQSRYYNDPISENKNQKKKKPYKPNRKKAKNYLRNIANISGEDLDLEDLDNLFEEEFNDLEDAY